MVDFASLLRVTHYSDIIPSFLTKGHDSLKISEFPQDFFRTFGYFLWYTDPSFPSSVRGQRVGTVTGGGMASRHETVKLRSRNRHVSVTSLPRPEPPAPWQLDLVNERRCRGEETILLPPKVFTVLRYLHEHPERLVTKQELLDAVWPDIVVTEAVLKNCILKLREAASAKLTYTPLAR